MDLNDWPNQIMIHGLSAEGTGEVLSIGRWKEQVIAPEFLLEDRDVDDVSEGNRNAFLYEDKRSFRPEGLGEVKRVTGAEDVGLQPRLVTRVRLHNSREFLSLPWTFFTNKWRRYMTLSRDTFHPSLDYEFIVYTQRSWVLAFTVTLNLFRPPKLFLYLNNSEGKKMSQVYVQKNTFFPLLRGCYSGYIRFLLISYFRIDALLCKAYLTRVVIIFAIIF